MQDICDRFYKALKICAGPEPVKVRLKRAWLEQLSDISADSLPQSVRTDFDSLAAAMKAVKPLPAEHPAAASVRKMSDRDAAKYTRLVVVMHKELLVINSSSQEVKEQTELASPAEEVLEFKSGRRLN